MFTKLLKHEWRASAGMLGVLSLAALGLSALGAVILRILVNYGDELLDGELPLSLVGISLITMLFFLFVALIVYVVAGEIMLLARFYKNKFTDEGYLTFTLPVNSRQIFLASTLNMAAWMAITVAVFVTVLMIVLLFGTATEGLVNTQIFSYIGQILKEVIRLNQELLGTAVLPLVIIQMVVGMFATPVIAMTCITLGSVIAKKHKIMASFIAYYIISVVMSTISTMIMFVVTITQLGSAEINFESTYIIEICLQAALAVAGYFLSTHLMRKNLNLP